MSKTYFVPRAVAPVMALAALMVAASANASTITYSTNAPGTGFSGGASLTLDASGAGVPGTLTFIPNIIINTGVPSNVNFGNFTLVCPTCTTQAGMAGAVFDAFTFDLVIVDLTDGNATGTFVGTSTGGAVFSNLSQISINWAPLIIGPGTTNATSGNFGSTTFSTTVFTGIVAPNSGSVPGQTTVQGFVDAVPEPSAIVLLGTAMLGLGLIRRKKPAQS